jgi:phosphoserine phosphatase
MIRFAGLIKVVVLLGVTAGQATADPLPSWSDSKSRTAIVDFVESVTDPDSGLFVPVADRIAVFDNDGTLWAEQPVYFQLMYAIDVVAARAKADPSFASTDALKAAAAGDLAGVMAHGEEGLVEIVNASHSGMSVAEFQESARRWLDTTPHPTHERPIGSLVYQPMLELLSYLRDNGFSTYIVSGGGIDFIRAIAEDAYGIPPHQVVGSMGGLEYEIVDGVPQVVKQPSIVFIDDKAGKPVGIMRRIGKRPILAGGNSDGDFEMLEWTTAGEGPRLGLIVHHTDAEREWAYDRDSHIGQLNRGLDEGPQRGWLIVDMESDWDRVFPAAQ